MTYETVERKLMVTQAQLIAEVLDRLYAIPEMPTTGAYLSYAAATEIVDETVAYVIAKGSQVEAGYLAGHRKRLALTLSMIPRAPHPDARLLDVGCYGYMGFWARRHLGYGHVEGIEWQPSEPAPQSERRIRVGDEEFAFNVHNFDITRGDWPIEGIFDTVLLLETLEHAAHDPSGILTNITARLSEGGQLVASVPNSVSYMTLRAFLMGAPPWTYWFYNCDLEHEPRHSFEYTPIFFKAILRAAGLEEIAFRSIYAYADEANLADISRIGSALSIPIRYFGDTLIAVTVKQSALDAVRFPDLIYDRDGYYHSTYPILLPRLEAAQEHFLTLLGAQRYAVEHNAPPLTRLEAPEIGSRDLQMQMRMQVLEAQVRTSEQQAAEALQLCASYLRRLIGFEEAERRRWAEGWLLHRDGKPIALVRRLLFHASGKPRRLAWHLVLKSNGQPNAVFRSWLMSSEYRRLPAALSFPARRQAFVDEAREGIDALRPAGQRSWLHSFVLSRDGRPLPWVRLMLFDRQRRPRRLFRRALVKKNGVARPLFRAWLTERNTD